MAEAGPLDELASARVDLLRGQIAFASGLGSDAPPLLLKAAKRLEPLDLGLARETYLNAWMAAMFAGRLAGAGDLVEVASAARMLPPPPHPPRRPTCCSTAWRCWSPTARPPRRRRCGRQRSAFASARHPRRRGLRWGWLAQRPPASCGMTTAGTRSPSGRLQLAREAGALDQLPIDLAALGCDGHPGAVTSRRPPSLIAEADVVAEATGSRSRRSPPCCSPLCAAQEAEAAPLIEATIAEAPAGGPGHRGDLRALGGRDPLQRPRPLRGGAGRGRSRPARTPPSCYVSMWALPELIEAAARSGKPERRTRRARPAGGNHPGRRHRLGAGHRGALPGAAERRRGRRAVSTVRRSTGSAAPGSVRNSPAPTCSTANGCAARAAAATPATQLRTAHEMLAAIGPEAFAERARRELLATGETVRKRDGRDRATELTAQEAPDRPARPRRAVQPRDRRPAVPQRPHGRWHLGKVFAKLGISSRRELRRALAHLPPADSQA